MKQLFTLSCIIFLGACAPKFSEQEISQARLDMQASQDKVSALQNELMANKAYSEGSCTTPARYKKPTPYVTNEEEAKDYSYAYCLSPLACDVNESALDLDSAAERFLGSELCSRYTDQLRTDGQITNNTVLNIFEAFVDSRCEQESTGFWAGLWRASNCVASASAKITKLAQLKNCLNNKHKQYLKDSQDWLHYPITERQACESLQVQLDQTQQDLVQKTAIYQLMIY